MISRISSFVYVVGVYVGLPSKNCQYLIPLLSSLGNVIYIQIKNRYCYESCQQGKQNTCYGSKTGAFATFGCLEIDFSRVLIETLSIFNTIACFNFNLYLTAATHSGRESNIFSITLCLLFVIFLDRIHKNVKAMFPIYYLWPTIFR